MHVDLAILAEADGVHIGQEDFPLPAVRQLVGPKMCIGLSTHSPEQARAAVAVGADYIGVGPIFATKTKEDVSGPGKLRLSLDWVAANISIPSWPSAASRNTTSRMWPVTGPAAAAWSPNWWAPPTSPPRCRPYAPPCSGGCRI